MGNKIHQESCHICGFTCSANNLARHIKVKHGENEYFVYKKYLDDRINEIKNKKHNEALLNNKIHIQCPYCDRIEVSISLMKQHIKSIHPKFLDEYNKFVEKDLNEKKLKHKEESLRNSKTNYICEFCGEEFPSKQLPSHIKHKHGNESYLIFKEKLEQKKLDHLNENNHKIICPICNEEFDGLLKHIFYKHNLSKDEFKKLYPNVRMFNDKRKKQNIICEECGKKFEYNNLYMIHLKKFHIEKYNELKLNKKDSYKKYECKICGFKTNQIYQHIFESHREISWEDYCLKYNHNISDKTYFSKEHREKLSKKAIENNISNHPNRSYYFLINDENYPKALRSFEEFKIISILLDKHIKFDYEKDLITWTDKNNFEHHYVVDITINNQFYEIKGNSEKRINSMKYEEKYIKVNEVLNAKNKKLIFINYEKFLEIFSIKNDEYSELFFIEKIKNLLNNDKLKILYDSFNGKRNPRLFQKIDKEYKNNKNLIIR